MKKIIVTRPLLEEDVSVVYIALRKISMSGPGYSYISYWNYEMLPHLSIQSTILSAKQKTSYCNELNRY